MHAFVALIIAAAVVSVLTPGPADVKIVRVVGITAMLMTITLSIVFPLR